MESMKDKMIEQMNEDRAKRILQPGLLVHQLFPREKVMALSWKEPFCSLMSAGKIETRTWPTNYRGLVLMCTSVRSYNLSQLLNICGERQYNRVWDFLSDQDKHVWCGYAISIGNLIDCRPMTPADKDQCYVKYHSDLWCHVYTDVRKIYPFAWKGMRKWTKVSPAIIEMINIKL